MRDQHIALHKTGHDSFETEMVRDVTDIENILGGKVQMNIFKMNDSSNRNIYIWIKRGSCALNGSLQELGAYELLERLPDNSMLTGRVGPGQVVVEDVDESRDELAAA